MIIVVGFVVGILMGAFGGILMKIGAKDIGTIKITSSQQFIEFLFHQIVNIPLVGGLILYFLSALIWIYLLTKLDISYVQPILALTYVVTPVLAIFILNESVPPVRWIGIVVIIIGVAIVAKTSGS